MLERYTNAARKVVPLACREAAARGASLVGPEHLLLALAGLEGSAQVLEESGVESRELHEALDAEEARALAYVGISLADVKEQVEENFGSEVWNTPPPSRRKLSYASSTKTVLKLVRHEAAALADSRIRPEHLLLAITCASAGTHSLLIDLGVSPAELRERTLAALAANREA